MVTPEQQATPKKKKTASLMNFFGRAGHKNGRLENNILYEETWQIFCKWRIQTTDTVPSTPPPAAASSAIGETLVEPECMVIEDSPNKKERLPKQSHPPNTLKKAARQDPSLVSYKNGKIVFSEKKLGLERHPSVVAAVFNFHQLVAQIKKDAPESLPLTSIPAEHLSLIAMMVQERDVTINSLVKSIESQLCPVVFGESRSSNSDILAPGVVEATIMDIAEHRNYGVSLSDLQGSCPIALEDVPTNLSIQRWEVRDLQLLPEDVRGVVLQRRNAREAAHEECVQWFRSLDSDVLSQILSGTLKKLKLTQSKSAISEPHSSTDTGAQSSGRNQKSGKAPDSASDKQQQQQAHILPGQRSLQNFFSKDKNADKSKRGLTSQPSFEHKSYYECTFLGFHLRLNATMYKYKRPSSFDSQGLDSVLQATCQAPNQGASLNTDSGASALLCEFVERGKKGRERPEHASKISSGEDLDEAELLQLRLQELPKKLIQFHTSQRPAYWGTWSRQLKGVSGRHPFGMDTSVLDYEVDSDAEWEAEEDEGEELNSENDENDDDDDDDDDEDDEDFDEESGFIVSDHLSTPRLAMDPIYFSTGHIDSFDGDGGGDGVDDNQSDSGTESEFISENEVMEDIDPDEEVCASHMDVDDEAPDTTIVEVVADSSSRPVRTRRKVPLDQQKRNLAELREESRAQQRQRRRQRVQPLVPVVVGPVWEQSEAASETVTQQMIDLLEALTVSLLGGVLPLSISTDPSRIQPTQQKDQLGKTTDAASVSAPVARKAKEFTNDDLSVLVSIVHGSSLGVSRLVDEIKQKITDASKAQIERLIHEHAVKEKRPPATRPLWY
ncbi:hypothetical protein GGF40_001255, partial [Coemansia sp. RSA 1286]